MNYQKQDMDTHYRRISLSSTTLPEFTPFTAGSISADEGNSQVLEIRRNDGTTLLIESPEKRIVTVDTSSRPILRIPAGTPTHHLYISPYIHGAISPVRYYLPHALPQSEQKRGYVEVLIPAARYGMQNLALLGDEYFNALFEIQMN